MSTPPFIAHRELYPPSDSAYRYHLRRALAPNTPNMFRSLLDPAPPGERVLLYVMVNPSTATSDEGTDDATIRKCRGFAEFMAQPNCEGEAFDAFEVVNLFAYRATDVRELLKEADAAENVECIIGPHNDHWIRESARRATRVVVAWGAKSGRLGRLIHDRAEDVVDTLSRWHKRPLLCIDTSKSGDPIHPLMAPYGPMRAWKRWPA